MDVQTTATMFAVMNGFIIATILSSASSRHRYKERMDMIVVSSSSSSAPVMLASYSASGMRPLSSAVVLFSF